MSVQEGLAQYLKAAVDAGASDLHFSAGSPVRFRTRGELTPVDERCLSPRDTMAIAIHILVQAGRLTATEAEEAARTLRDEDCAYSAPGIGRFRVNICRQRSSAAIVLRAIASDIPTAAQLGLPEVVEEIAQEERGLVLVTGATGSGKSTTLAAMIGYINRNRNCKIVTIEDPIEYIYRDASASIMQREVGSDTNDFAKAMRAALRQDPDVILVGEMRDRETVDIALKASETGHLVLSTVHTPDTPKTIGRLLSNFDPQEQFAVRVRLADSLKAVISQRLLPRSDGQGRVPAIEVMRSTGAIRDCIVDEDKTGQILDYVRSGRDQYKMQTFDQHVMELYEQGLVSLEHARAAATSPADFERNLVYS